MPRFLFKMGTSTSGMLYTESLPVPFTVGFFTYKPYQDVVDVGDLSTRGVGHAEATWRQGFMTRAQRDQARIFCPGASATVYIDTRVNDDANYHTFKTKMHWPEEEDPQAGRFLDVLFRFSIIEEIP